jgi:hypothetical protein
MLYRILADTVVIVHLLWILFLICGAIPGARYKVVRVLHLSGLVFAVILQVFGWYCPLTHLEVWLRQQHDAATAYAGSFIITYLERIVYLDVSPAAIFAGTLAIAAVTAWWYVRSARRAQMHG